MRNESLSEQLDAHAVNADVARQNRKDREADKDMVADFLKAAHAKCCDDAREGLAYARRAVAAFHHIGLLNKNERRLWELALTACPGHDHGGGRAWCAYCGDLPVDGGSEHG